METPLYIPPKQKVKGLTVFCKLCHTNVSEHCKENNRKIQFCSNGNRHVFKVYINVPGSKNERKTKTLESRDLNIARKQAIDFEKEVKENIATAQKQQKTEGKQDSQNKPYLLVEALAKYISEQHDENVPHHMKKNLSKDYLKSMEIAFKFLAKSLVQNKHDLNTFRVENFNNHIVGEVYADLEKRELSNRSHNKYFTFYGSFLRDYSEKHNPVPNWFAKGRKKSKEYEPESISWKELQAIQNEIKPENGIVQYNSAMNPERQLYRSYLRHGILLAAYTGRRREELINFKWNNIETNDEGNQCIKSEDYKVNNMKKLKSNEEKKYNYVPVIAPLKELLNELGYEKMKGTNEFILAPEIRTKRNRILADNLSRGFGHFFDRLNTGKKLTLKSLRKSYITSLYLFLGNVDNLIAITGHSSMDVVNKHYIHKRVVAFSLAKNKFTVFPQEAIRKEELTQIRAEKETIDKTMEVLR